MPDCFTVYWLIFRIADLLLRRYLSAFLKGKCFSTVLSCPRGFMQRKKNIIIMGPFLFGNFILRKIASKSAMIVQMVQKY